MCRIEPMGSVPDQTESNGIRSKICDALRSIRRAPSTVSILGIIGAGCVIGTSLAVNGLLNPQSRGNETAIEKSDDFSALASAASFGGVLGIVSILGWASQTFLNCGPKEVEIAYLRDSNNVLVSSGGKEYILKPDDPNFKTKYSDVLIMMCANLMKVGAPINKIYGMVTFSCEKIDEILGEINTGNFIVERVKEWFVENYKTEFTAYAKFIGLRDIPKANWVSGNNKPTPEQEMVAITESLKICNLV